ncbi:MAG: 50S ribosomal protein L9, partial [Bacteroidales bacterium]|nr:50S ribosomal protein L9 [Bacteroidales bacterium]
SSLVKIPAKLNENGKIYGSVTTAQIAEALVAAGFEVDKKNIEIVSEEVKEIGIYDAKVKCYKGVFADLKFEVVAAE